MTAPLPFRRIARRAVIAPLTIALALAVLGAAPAAKTPVRRATTTHRAPATRRAATTGPKLAPKQQAADALALEQLGAYGEAARRLRLLRRDVAPDLDLELAIALDDARSGALDSAAARLQSPSFTAALADTNPPTRRTRYPWQRDQLWIDGRYTGWPWYIARARAEVAAERGEWPQARDAARLAVALDPLAGREWLILAVCAGHAGDLDEAERAARTAAYLDPTVPEAFYVDGLLEWRAGRRAEAQGRFRGAVALDSTWQAPALALVRSRLPGSAPDTLPATFLNGARRAALLTSPVRPKPEEFVQMDLGASVVEQRIIPFPDSLKAMMKPVKIYLNVLVDDTGHPVLAELPWFQPNALPLDALHLTLASVPGWIFRPGIRLGRPYPQWTPLQVTYDPQGPSQTTR